MTRPSVDSPAWSDTKVLGPLDQNLHITELAVDRYGRIPATAGYVFALAWSWENAWHDGDRYPQSCMLYRVSRS